MRVTKTVAMRVPWTVAMRVPWTVAIRVTWNIAMRAPWTVAMRVPWTTYSHRVRVSVRVWYLGSGLGVGLRLVAPCLWGGDSHGDGLLTVGTGSREFGDWKWTAGVEGIGGAGRAAGEKGPTDLGRARVRVG